VAALNLGAWRNWMRGEHCIVVGCGPSAQQLGIDYRAHWTIGCNRALTFCEADFAVCVEPYRDRDIWRVVTESRPLVVFTHLLADDQIGHRAHPRMVVIDTHDVQTWLTPGEIDSPPLRLCQSPFFATAIAMHLGFGTIGLVGVDYTEDRYPDVSMETERWRRLDEIATGMGSVICNLNPASRLSSIQSADRSVIHHK